MTETTTAPAYATIPLELDGEALEVVADPTHCRAISQAFGGIRPAMDAVHRLNVRSIAMILNIARGKPTAQPAATEAAILAAGLSTVATSMMVYLTAVANGGRMVED